MILERIYEGSRLKEWYMLSGKRDHSPGTLIIIIIYMIDYDMQDVDQLFLISTEYWLWENVF